MSYENRKAMYDKLKAEGKEDKIDPALIAEFGDLPKADPEPVKEEAPKQKKKGKK